MRRFVSIFLVFVLVMPYALKISVWVWYVQNKEYIATTLCENRDRPEMECEGKCVLNKALEKADCCAGDDRGTTYEGHENAPIPPLKKLAEQITLAAFLPANQTLLTLHCAVQQPSKVVFIDQQHCKGRLLVSGIFHPPCFTV